MVVVHKFPTPPPQRNAADTTRPPALTLQQQAKLDAVVKHFAGPYVLPGVEEDKRALMEEEQSWLVSFPETRFALRYDGLVSSS